MSNKCATQLEIKNLDWGGDKSIENNSKLCTIGYALSHLGAKRSNGYTDTKQYPDNRIVTLGSTNNPIEVSKAKTRFYATYPVFKSTSYDSGEYYSMIGADGTCYINVSQTRGVSLPNINDQYLINLMVMRVSDKGDIPVLYTFDSSSSYRYKLLFTDPPKYIESYKPSSVWENPYGYSFNWQPARNNKLEFYLSQNGETIRSGYLKCVSNYNIPSDYTEYDQSSVIGSQGRFLISDIEMGSIWIVMGENPDWADSGIILNIKFDQDVLILTDSTGYPLFNYKFELMIRFYDGGASLKITDATLFSIDLDT